MMVLVFWFLDCWKGARVVTTAPKKDQLEDGVWKEIRDHWSAFKSIHSDAVLMDSLEIRMRPDQKDWGAKARVAGVRAGEKIATKAAGTHAPHMLYIIEEGTGMPKPIMKAIKNTCTAPHNIRAAFGNPNHQQDPLHEMAESYGVEHVQISALDHPNVVLNEVRDPDRRDVLNDPQLIPGAVSRKSIIQRLADNGYDPTSREYMTRVRGISPKESEESLLKYDWLSDCVENDDVDTAGGPALGVDVANSESGDKAALAEGIGARLDAVTTYTTPDANLWARETVATKIRADSIDPRRVGVDSIGVGAGAYNELTRLELPVQELNSSWKPVPMSGAERFLNFRAQMWWQLRKDVRNRAVCLPNDEELFQDLTAIKWEVTAAGKIKIVSKDKIKADIGRSPDRGDAVAYWNWVRQKIHSTSRGGTIITL